MDIFLRVLWLIVSLVVLVKSADYFTLWAESFWLYLWMSSFVVWATIVAVWGSMPELATSIIWALRWQTAFAVDNVIGSNIANTLLIWWIVAIVVWTLKVKEELVDVDLPFFFISSALFVLFIYDWVFNWKEWIISLLMLSIFIFYTLSDKTKSSENEGKIKKIKPIWIVYIVLWVLWIFIWAKYTVVSVTELWKLLNISSSIITMLAVAIWTSLPELIISLRAAMKWKHSIALWNIFGSNTFNALAVVWIPSLFLDLTVSETVMTYWIPLFIVSTLAFIFTTSDNQIQKWEWMALLVLYIVFVWNVIWII
jgi:cation:H+ antiporter